MFTVADQDAALAFYTEKLGFEVRSDTASARTARALAGGAPPGSHARLALNPPMGGQPGGGSIGVETPTLAEHRRLSAIGGIDLDPEPMPRPACRCCSCCATPTATHRRRRGPPAGCSPPRRNGIAGGDELRGPA